MKIAELVLADLLQLIPDVSEQLFSYLTTELDHGEGELVTRDLVFSLYDKSKSEEDESVYLQIEDRQTILGGFIIESR